jgi:hypothetical protein
MAEMKNGEIITAEVTAVVARIKIPSGVLAGFQPGDRMEIEALSGLAPAITFKVNGKQIATAALARNGDLLCATVKALGPEPDRQVYDRWLIRKQKKEEA